MSVFKITKNGVSHTFNSDDKSTFNSATYRKIFGPVSNVAEIGDVEGQVSVDQLFELVQEKPESGIIRAGNIDTLEM